MIVDDDKSSLSLLQGILRRDYTVSAVTSGKQALDGVRKINPSLIVLDLRMPDMDGYEVLERLKSSENTDIPVIILSGVQEATDEVRAIELGAVDYIHKPVVSTLVLTRIKLHLELEAYKQNLERRVEERTAALLYQQEATIDILAYATDCRDNTTGQHLERTRKCVELLLEHLPQACGKSEGYAISAHQARNIALAAPLHDLGKVTIPDGILLKPGKLTPEEFEEMKLHTVRGAQMLKKAVVKLDSAELLSTAMEIVLGHHEKWDGSGYPSKIKGLEIPLSARVMAIADVYDALRTKRPYKDPMGADDSLRLICEGRENHFDPVLVDTFMAFSEKLEPFYSQ